MHRLIRSFHIMHNTLHAPNHEHAQRSILTKRVHVAILTLHHNLLLPTNYYLLRVTTDYYLLLLLLVLECVYTYISQHTVENAGALLHHLVMKYISVVV